MSINTRGIGAKTLLFYQLHALLAAFFVSGSVRAGSASPAPAKRRTPGGGWGPRVSSPPKKPLPEQTPLWCLTEGRALCQIFPSQPLPPAAETPQRCSCPGEKKETSAGPSGFKGCWGQIKPEGTMGPLAPAPGRALQVLLISWRNPELVNSAL